MTTTKVPVELLNLNVSSTTSSSDLDPTVNNSLIEVTAQSELLLINPPTGTWQNGQSLIIRIKDNGTSRSLIWDTDYRVIGTTLPTDTVASKWLYVTVVYNSTDSVWDVVGIAQET